MQPDAISRRDFVVGSAAVGAAMLASPLSAAAQAKQTFTILHTNDMHSAFIGMGPSADYTPLTVNDDATRGGFVRLAALMAQRRQMRQARCWCSMPATTAWARGSGPRRAKPVASCR